MGCAGAGWLAVCDDGRAGGMPFGKKKKRHRADLNYYLPYRTLVSSVCCAFRLLMACFCSFFYRGRWRRFDIHAARGSGNGGGGGGGGLDIWFLFGEYVWKVLLYACVPLEKQRKRYGRIANGGACHVIFLWHTTTIWLGWRLFDYDVLPACTHARHTHTHLQSRPGAWEHSTWTVRVSHTHIPPPVRACDMALNMVLQVGRGGNDFICKALHGVKEGWVRSVCVGGGPLLLLSETQESQCAEMQKHKKRCRRGVITKPTWAFDKKPEKSHPAPSLTLAALLLPALRCLAFSHDRPRSGCAKC